MKLAQMEIAPTPTLTCTLTRISALGVERLKAFGRSAIWRSLIWRSLVWRSLVSRAGSRRKTLSVRETAALGDRRFVSVIQFERQRFLIGSSPSSVTLLSQLPDESVGGEAAAEPSREQSREQSGKEGQRS